MPMRSMETATPVVGTADALETALAHVLIEVQPPGVHGASHDLPAADESQLPCDIPDDASPTAVNVRPPCAW